MALGDMARAGGRLSDANEAYRAAAAAEVEAYGLVPSDRPKTRGVLAVSAAALYRKGGDPRGASLQAHAFLAEPDLPEWTRLDLEDLLLEMRAEQAALEQGRTLGGEWVEWRLRGGVVGTGTAPLDVVSRKIGQIERCAIRVYEYLAGEALRHYGAPREEVTQGLELLMSQPAAGSFRFRLRFSVPTEQTELFPEGSGLRSVTPRELSETFFRVLEAVVEDDAAALGEMVLTEDYQEAFLHLVKVLLPDGKDVGSIEVVRGGDGDTDAALLQPTHRLPIERRIRARQRKVAPRAERVLLVDTLRALHLNQRWIVLGEQQERQVYVGEAMILEDVVEGLVAQLVRVTAHRDRGRLYIDEIEAAAPHDERGEYAIYPPVPKARVHWGAEETSADYLEEDTVDQLPLLGPGENDRGSA